MTDEGGFANWLRRAARLGTSQTQESAAVTIERGELMRVRSMAKNIAQRNGVDPSDLNEFAYWAELYSNGIINGYRRCVEDLTRDIKGLENAEFDPRSFEIDEGLLEQLLFPRD